MSESSTSPPTRRVFRQTERRGTIGWEYLAQGPAVWRVLISRQTCC
jgi:uncharacterized protein (DUF2249 family)